MTKTPTSWTHPLRTLMPQSKCHLPGTDASCHIPCGPASKLDLKKADKWRKNQAWKWALRWLCFQFSSVTQLCPTLCDPMDCMQHTRLPCPSPTPRAYSNVCPLSWWCHPTISSSVVPFSCLQSFPASGSFQMSQFFASGGQSIGASASISVLPMNWFPLGWTGWISLQSKRDSQESSPTSQFNSINSLALIFLCSPTLTSIHDYWKNHSFD